MLLLLCAAGVVRADPASPGTALIVRVPGDEAVAVPLRAELSSYRFQVVELSERSAGRVRPLADIAQQYSAQAALRAVADQIAVELWIAGGDANPTGSVEVVRAGPGSEPTVLALRVTEVMRARGLRLVLPPSPVPVVIEPTPRPTTEAPAISAPAPAGAPAPSGNAAPDASANAPEHAPASTPEAPPPAKATPIAPATAPENVLRPPPSAAAKPTPPQPEVEAEPEATEPEQAADAADHNAPTQLLHVELAAASAFSAAGSPGVAPSGDVWAQVRLQPLRMASLSLFGLIPLWPTELSSSQGSADMRIWSIGGFVDLHTRWQPVELSFGLGGASLLTRVGATQAAPGYMKASPSLLRTVALLGRIGASVALTSHLQLQARGLLGVSVPELRVAFANEPVARWGLPFVVLSLGLDYGF
ncbi:MAG: hypothetical protein RL701_4078 [Pseudomonadota bacterium]